MRLSLLLRAIAVGTATLLAMADSVYAQRKPPPTDTAVIPAGTYRPLFPPTPGESEIHVAAFRMDRVPVTNAEFADFVRARSEWTRGRVAPVLAEPAYLSSWASPQSPGEVLADRPVVDVSWFAARAYCVWRGARLPTEAEWERAAAASPTSADGSSDRGWQKELLEAYSRPRPARLPRVGGTPPNFWGLYDLHGVVWEWVLDFGNAVSAFSSGPDRLRFCGTAAASARDATDFAAFERTALRSSLRANFVLSNLGFRCAADVAGEPK